MPFDLQDITKWPPGDVEQIFSFNSEWKCILPIFILSPVQFSRSVMSDSL